jgi:polysaccharide biosynthesis/export protein
MRLNLLYHRMSRTVLLSILSVLGLVLAGCQSGYPRAAAPAGNTPIPSLAIAATENPHLLREGDTIRLSFPVAPSLDTQQQVRRDGKIALPLIGEVPVAGKTPLELEEELSELYSKELVSGEVFVSVVASSYPVFVTGAVVRPGKIEADRPITALEAIMEAGGFELSRANGQAVVVVRHERDGVKNYTLNLMRVLEGRSDEAFYLKPSDIIYVPERFAWF